MVDGIIASWQFFDLGFIKCNDTSIKGSTEDQTIFPSNNLQEYHVNNVSLVAFPSQAKYDKRLQNIE